VKKTKHNPNTTQATPEAVQVGVISVDSGHIVIHDVCYDLDLGDERTTYDEGLSHQLRCKMDRAGFGVSLMTGRGDGLYPVYAEYHDHKTLFGRRIARIVIEFIRPDGSDPVIQ
jgi:hypothetical protein